MTITKITKPVTSAGLETARPAILPAVAGPELAGHNGALASLVKKECDREAQRAETTRQTRAVETRITPLGLD